MTAEPTSPREGPLASVIPFPRWRRARSGQPSGDVALRDPAVVVPFPRVHQSARRPTIDLGDAPLAPVVDLAAHRSWRDEPQLDPAA